MLADTDYTFGGDGNTQYFAPLYDVGNGLYSPTRYDKSTQATITIGYEHHEIHGGSHYYMAGKVTLDSASTDFVDFGVTTPNTTEWAHMNFSLTSLGQFTFTIYEGMTFASSDGTAAVAFNNNRNSTNTSSLTICTNPGYTAASSDIIYGPRTHGKDGNVNQVVGGNFQDDRELILKQNTNYIFRIDSQTAANVINYYASWYEHTDKA